MLGEAKPSFWEKEVLNAKLILTQARFSILLLLMVLFSTREILNNKQQIVVLEAKSVGSSRSACSAVALVIPGVTRQQITHSEEVKYYITCEKLELPGLLEPRLKLLISSFFGT